MTKFTFVNGARGDPIKVEWPWWAQMLKMKAIPEDKGIGDVVARMIGVENSEAFKTFYKSVTGKDCDCTGRQKRWNIMYPLNADL